MSLLSNLKADQLIARKARDEVKSGLLTALLSEAAMVGKNQGNRESTDPEVLNMIRKFKKNATDTLGILPEGSFREKTIKEIAILDSYLPVQFSEDQIRTILTEFAKANPEAKIGQLMKHLSQNYSGQYDGKLASAVAGRLLG